MRNLLAFVIIVFVAFSCNKDNPEITETESVLVYYPLSVGNYWIYQHYKIDSLGNGTLLGQTDSIVIAKDTLINDIQYYLLNEYNNSIFHSENNKILRDSANYIVNHLGKKIITNIYLDNTFKTNTIEFENDTLILTNYKMEIVNDPKMVPAGLFNVLNAKSNLTLYSDKNGNPIQLELNNYYAPNVGPILNSYIYFHDYIMNRNRIEKRLIRYHIQD